MGGSKIRNPQFEWGNIPHSEFAIRGLIAFAVFRRTEMGRTVLPFSQVLAREYEEWQKFRRALRKEDQEAFDRLFDRAKLHIQAAVYTSHPWPMESILLSICLEHEKLLAEIISKLKERDGDTGSGVENSKSQAPNPK